MIYRFTLTCLAFTRHMVLRAAGVSVGFVMQRAAGGRSQQVWSWVVLWQHFGLSGRQGCGVADIVDLEKV